MSEDKFQQSVALLQAYQQQGEYLQQQLAQIQLSAQGLDDAIVSLEALGKAEKNPEVLVPIGIGTYVFSEVKDTDRVLLGVGAGVSVERNREESIVTLRSRKGELEGVMKQVSEAYSDLMNQMEQLQSKIQDMAPRQQ